MKHLSKKILFMLIGLSAVGIILISLLIENGLTAKVESAWEKVCSGPDEKAACSIVQRQFLTKVVDGKKQAVGKILSLAVVYVRNDKEEQYPYMSLSMPLGVDLRAGAAMKVDEGKEIPLQFLQCTNLGCDSSILLNDELLQKLKKGSKLTVGFLPWGSNKPTAVNASLSGFTKALKSITPN